MIRTTVTSADAKGNLFVQTKPPEGDNGVPLVSLAYKNGRGGEKALGDFDPAELKAVFK